MGKNNRQRRAEKHRRRERTRGPRTDERAPYLGLRDVADFLVLDAAEAAERGDAAEQEGILLQLRELDGFAAPALTAALV
jgi:hypothetical protein